MIETEIRIGTSGFHYKHWIGRYYPAGTKSAEMLTHYLRDFDTVEINNSFYHLPKSETFDAWRTSVPRQFVFALKGSRFLTHMKKLKDPEEGIARFFENADHLGRKMGPVLFQLPPHWHSNPERLDRFLRALPKKHRYAFELRDQTWLDATIYAILRKHRAAFCIYGIAGFETPHVITTDFTYIRLHGPEATAYRGLYGRKRLQTWAREIDSLRGKLKKIFVYFDNDQEAFAVEDALMLKKLLAE